MNNTPVIAVINSNEDIVDVIRLILSQEGLSSVPAHVVDFKKGREDATAFFSKHKPGAVIYDIAPPYEENWTFCKLIKSSEETKDIPFILTTTNKARLEELVGKTDTIEILGKPFDMEEVVKLVKKNLKK